MGFMTPDFESFTKNQAKNSGTAQRKTSAVWLILSWEPITSLGDATGMYELFFRYRNRWHDRRHLKTGMLLPSRQVGSPLVRYEHLFSSYPYSTTTDL